MPPDNSRGLVCEAGERRSADYGSERAQAQRAGFTLIAMRVTVSPVVACCGRPGVVSSEKAAWYDFVGKKTASGDIPQQSHRHQRRSLAAAVGLREGENLDNSRSVIVKINDRGPYTRGRIMDLSPRTADALDMKHVGVASIVIGPLVRRARLAPRFKLPVRWCRNKRPARREARTSDNSVGGWFEN
jgi:rare lipoprotein A (peptidoglycan hydrolase)